MIKNVLFDLGGVLVDLDVRRTLNAFQRIVRTDDASAPITAQGLLGGHDSELIDRYQTGTISTPDFISTILSVCLPGTTEQQVRDAWFAMLLGIPEVNKQLLRDIHAAGYSIYVLSNINEMHVEWVHQCCPELRPAKRLFFSNEMHLAKPDPRCYLQVISEAGILPTETVYIDDLLPNIEEGRRHGFLTLHATDTSWRNELRNLLHL
jgi:putative hydrolase of the HAD superfamily